MSNARVFPDQDFHYNESRQRDWNLPSINRPSGWASFHYNESRQRDWNQIASKLTAGNQALSLQWIPATGLKLNPVRETELGPIVFHYNESRQRDWNKTSGSYRPFTLPGLSLQWIPATGLKLPTGSEGTINSIAFITMNPGNGIETLLNNGKPEPLKYLSLQWIPATGLKR